MFFKSNLRPAMAGAGAENVGKTKNSPFTFDTGSAEANDCRNFGESFGGGAPRSNPTPNKQNNNRNSGKKSFGGFSINFKDPKLWIIVGAAVLAVILAVVIIVVAVVANSGGDIKYQNNAYMAYKDNNGASYVVANGKLVEQAFEGDIELIVSADNSFAYVFDNTDEGVVMYLLNGKKVSPLLAGQPIDEVVAVATLEPGVIYTKTTGSGSHYMIYNEKNGDRQIVKENKDPEDFCISADGETVAFTIEGRNQDERILCIYEGGTYEQTSSKNGTPVAVSGNGDYIYYSQLNKEGVTELYVYDMAKEDPYKVDNSAYFRSILEMNRKGDEIIFTIERDDNDVQDVIPEDETSEGEETEGEESEGEYVSGITSHLYRYKEKKAENRIVDLGNGEVRTAGADPTIAVYEKFADTYFCSESATYFVTSRYERKIISANYSGKFSPDGNYFYYVTSKDKDLYRMDLNSSERASKKIYYDVTDFVVTEKGNLYILSVAEGDSEGELLFYNTSADKPEKVSYEATVISFYDYSDKMYFAEADSTTVKVSKESDASDEAKFGSASLTSVPYFVNANQKACYAVIYDSAAETCKIYYTSNGDKFSIIRNVDNCEAVMNGDEELDLSNYIIEQ